MAKIICNSTPIILLEKIGKLDLLEKLYSSVTIAEAVYNEVILDGSDTLKSCDFISANKWIDIQKIQDINAKRLFITSLHAGEVETMILAMETNADLVVLDDLLARKYAKNLEFTVTGTLGILLAAKKAGHIESVKTCLDGLIENGMYVSRALVAELLKKENN